MFRPQQILLWLYMVWLQDDAIRCCISLKLRRVTLAAAHQVINGAGQFFALAFSMLSM